MMSMVNDELGTGVGTNMGTGNSELGVADWELVVQQPANSQEGSCP